MQKPINSLNISNKAKNQLHKYGITYVEELSNLNLGDFKKFRGVGEKTYSEIKELISKIYNGESNIFDSKGSKISQFNLSKRASDALINENITSLDELYKTPFEVFENKENIGAKTLNEIKLLYSFSDFDCKERKYSDEDLLQLSLYPIETLGLSNRPYNKLKMSGVKTLDELVTLDLLDKSILKGLGKKSIEEVNAKIEAWIEENKIIIQKKEHSEKNLLDNFEIEKIKSIFEKLILINSDDIYQICIENELNFDADNFSEFLINFINTKEMIQKFRQLFIENSCSGVVDKFSFDKFLIDVNQNLNIKNFSISEYFLKYIMVKMNNVYILKNEDIKTYFGNKNVINEDKHFSFLYERIFNDKTLQEIAESNNITRERVRQILSKEVRNIPYLLEDCYKTVFEYFNFSKNDFLGIFKKESNITYNYLFAKYKKGKVALTVENVLDYNGFFKDEIITFFDSQRRHELNKNQIIFEILLNEFKAISLDELEKKYYIYIKQFDLDTNKYSMNFKSINNYLRNAKYIVFDHENKLRFVDIDYATFVETLDLSKYKSSVISSYLIFNDNLDLMKEFDIRDGHELFYVLKVSKNIELLKNNVVFRRVPTLIFDGMTDEEQTVNFLKELSPISTEEYFTLYEERYGAKKESAMSNLSKYLNYYMTDGKYSIDVPTVDERDTEFLKQKLDSKSIWFINEVENLVEKYCKYTSNEAVNSASLLRLGYKLFPAGYVLKSEYNNAFDFFDSEIFNSNLVDIGKIDKRIIGLSIFGSYLDKIKHDMDYIEIDKKQFVSTDYFCQMYFIDKETLIKIQHEMLGWCKDEYFNSNTILNELQISDIPNNLKEIFLKNKWFTSCFLRQKEGVSSLVLKDTIILSRNSEILSVPMICKWIVEKYEKMSISQITNKFNQIFGCEYDKNLIAEKIRTKGLWDEIVTDSIDLYIDNLMKKTESEGNDLFEESFY